MYINYSLSIFYPGYRSDKESKLSSSSAEEPDQAPQRSWGLKSRPKASSRASARGSKSSNLGQIRVWPELSKPLKTPLFEAQSLLRGEARIPSNPGLGSSSKSSKMRPKRLKKSPISKRWVNRVTRRPPLCWIRGSKPL